MRCLWQSRQSGEIYLCNMNVIGCAVVVVVVAVEHIIHSIPMGQAFNLNQFKNPNGLKQPPLFVLFLSCFVMFVTQKLCKYI